MIQRALALLLVCSAVVGCTAVLSPEDRQCDTDADCEALGFEGAVCEARACIEPAVVEDPVWGCLGQVVEPVPDTSRKVALSIRLAFATDNSPLGTDTVVDVCDKLDITCTGTNPDYPKGIVPDANGVVNLDVVEGFDGFVRITNPETMDSRVYVGRPVIVPPKVEEIQILRPLEYETLAAIATKPADPERGTAIVLTVDCEGEAVGGVRIETPNADAETQEFYLINQAPTIPPTATETDADGFGGFFNLPPSSAVVRTFRAEDERFVGQSSFQVLANTISYVLVAPTPE